MAFLKKINFTANTDIYIWRITEDYDYLFSQVILKPNSLERVSNMKSDSHRKGFLAVRMLLQHCGYTDHDLLYDTTGKPILKDGKKISITHSFDYSVIAISDVEIGIDIELRRDKVLRIGDKFAKESFLHDLSDITKIRALTVLWGAKEAIFKIINEPGISFLDHIMVDSFLMSDYKTLAILNFKQQQTLFDIYFKEIENYTLVYAHKQ